jgi:hypothetical protein
MFQNNIFNSKNVQKYKKIHKVLNEEGRMKFFHEKTEARLTLVQCSEISSRSEFCRFVN